MRRCKKNFRGKTLKANVTISGSSVTAKVVCGSCGIRHRELRPYVAVVNGTSVQIVRRNKFSEGEISKPRWTLT